MALLSLLENEGISSIGSSSPPFGKTIIASSSGEESSRRDNSQSTTRQYNDTDYPREERETR